MSRAKPDYRGVFIERDGVRRPLVLDDELWLLLTRDCRQLSLRDALGYEDFDLLVSDCPFLELDNRGSPLFLFLEARLT